MRSLVFWIGAVLLLSFAANNAYGLYLRRDDYAVAASLPSSLFWIGLPLILSLACVLGALMKPREFREVFEEEPVQRQPWLDELKSPPKNEE